MHTWIKICGTTCLEDALNSIEAGADALGFIFAPSKRQVSPEQAQQIISQLPQGVERIGVFMNSPASEIADIVDKVELTGIQMHGEESPAEVYNCLPKDRRNDLRKIKTVLVNDNLQSKLKSNEDNKDIIDAWLLDSGAGSGRTFDWQAARNKLDGRQSRIIIAGGLTPENVAGAIGIFHPWGVDVVSGVERAPGRKGQEKLKAFVEAVRKVEKI
jgi:phosphoribosylanthranilate isomerase